MAIARAKRVGKTGKVIAVDRSQAMLNQAIASVKDLNLPIEFVCADAQNLPFEDNTFNGARGDRTLQHIANPGRAIAEMARVLRPAGHLVAMEGELVGHQRPLGDVDERLGQGYATGCVLIILSILSHSNDPNGYIWGRFFETLVGTIIALMLSQLFWPDTSSQQLDQGIAQTFARMGRLYSSLLTTYLQGTNSEETNAQSNEIKESLKTMKPYRRKHSKDRFITWLLPKPNEGGTCC